MAKNVVSNRVEFLLQDLVQVVRGIDALLERTCIVVPDQKTSALLEAFLAKNMPGQVLLGVTIDTLENVCDELLGSPFCASSECVIALDRHKIPQGKKEELCHACWKEGENSFSPHDPMYEKLKESYAFLKQYQLFSEEMQKPESVLTKVDTLIFFGFSSLPPALFLSGLQKKEKVHFFLLSPCCMYWEDIVSDKWAERLLEPFFVKKTSAINLQEIKELFLDRNPILANFGTLGKDFAHVLDRLEVEKQYALSSAIMVNVHAPHDSAPHENMSAWDIEQFEVTRFEGEKRALDQLQSDLLFLEGARKISVEADDVSVQIHSAPTPLREVEVLYDTLLNMQFDAPLSPGAICVYVEQLDSYLPHIERVFGGACSHFSYTVFGNKAYKKDPDLRLLLTMLALPLQRFSCELFTKIISTESVQKKYGLSEEECVLAQKIVNKLGFSFGYSEEHQKKLLQEDGFEKIAFVEGSWQEIETLFCKGFVEGAYTTEESTIVGTVFGIISSLFDDFSEGKMADKSLEEWSSWLLAIVEKYIASSNKGYYVIQEVVERLFRSPLRQEKLSYATWIKVVEDALESAVTKKNRYKAKEIIFTSSPTVVGPHEVVAMLGMHEGAQSKAYNELERKYSIVEAILAARKCLYISYTNYSFQAAAPQGPLYCVEALLKLIHNKDSIQHKHPLISPSLQFKQREEVKKISEWPKGEEKLSLYMDLERLRKILKNPLKEYLKDSLGLQITLPSEIAAQEQKYGWFDFMPQKDDRMSGSLGGAINDVQLSYAEKLSTFTPISIEFALACKEVQEKTPNHYVVPAHISEGISLYGMLQDGFKEGFVVHQAYSGEAVYSLVLDLMLRQILQPICGARNEIYFTRDRKRVSVQFTEVDMHIQQLLQFARKCPNMPLPLMPDVIHALAEGKKIPEVKNPYFVYFKERSSEEEFEFAANIAYSITSGMEVTHV